MFRGTALLSNIHCASQQSPRPSRASWRNELSSSLSCRSAAHPASRPRLATAHSRSKTTVAQHRLRVCGLRGWGVCLGERIASVEPSSSPPSERARARARGRAQLEREVFVAARGGRGSTERTLSQMIGRAQTPAPPGLRHGNHQRQQQRARERASAKRALQDCRLTGPRARAAPIIQAAPFVRRVRTRTAHALDRARQRPVSLAPRRRDKPAQERRACMSPTALSLSLSLGTLCATA